MLAYLVRRVVFAIAMMVAISFTSFWVFAGHLNALGLLYRQNPRPVAEIHHLTVLNHLDKPIAERYLLWVKGIIVGGDGRRTVYGYRIWPQVWSAFVHTAELAVGALVLALLLSVALGLISALRRGRPSDGLLRLVGYLTWSMPVFITAFVLQAAFARFDASWGFHPFFSYGVATGTGFGHFVSWYRHMTLPIVAVALSFIGLYSRYIRSGVLVTLNAPYSTVARAKGLPEWQVVIRHALRNALIPFSAVVTLDFSAVVGATLVVDIVFRLQGLGAYLYQGTEDFDPFELQALVVVMVLLVIAFGFVADAIYPRLDPRIRMT